MIASSRKVGDGHAESDRTGDNLVGGDFEPLFYIALLAVTWMDMYSVCTVT